MCVEVVVVMGTTSGHFEWASTAIWMACPMYWPSKSKCTRAPMASQTIIMGGVEQLQVPSVPVGMECTPWSTSQGLVTTHSWRQGLHAGNPLMAFMKPTHYDLRELLRNNCCTRFPHRMQPPSVFSSDCWFQKGRNNSVHPFRGYL